MRVSVPCQLVHAIHNQLRNEAVINTGTVTTAGNQDYHNALLLPTWIIKAPTSQIYTATITRFIPTAIMMDTGITQVDLP